MKIVDFTVGDYDYCYSNYTYTKTTKNVNRASDKMTVSIGQTVIPIYIIVTYFYQDGTSSKAFIRKIVNNNVTYTMDDNMGSLGYSNGIIALQIINTSEQSLLVSLGYAYCPSVVTTVYASPKSRTQTTYADIPTTITYNNTTYTIIDVKGQEILKTASGLLETRGFANCHNLTTAPIINLDIESFQSFFLNCNSLTDVSSFCSNLATHTNLYNVNGLFMGCASLRHAALVIPSNHAVTANSTFAGCINLISASNMILPASITDYTSMFANCTSLTTAPIIHLPPSSTTDTLYINMFQNCKNLTGNISWGIRNSFGTSNMFTGTTKEIYLINDQGNHTTQAVAVSVAFLYNNVHFEDFDFVTGTISSNIKRTTQTGVEDLGGDYATINASYTYSDNYLPVGWTVTRTVDLLKDNTTDITGLTWTNANPSVMTQQIISLGNVEAQKLGAHTFKFTLTEIISNDDDDVVHTLETVLIKVLDRAFATFDFYPGGEGLAVGTFSSGPGLQIAMDTTFDKEIYITLSDDTAQTTDYEILQTLTALGWDTGDDPVVT